MPVELLLPHDRSGQRVSIIRVHDRRNTFAPFAHEIASIWINADIRGVGHLLHGNKRMEQATPPKLQDIWKHYNVTAAYFKMIRRVLVVLDE